MTVNPKRIFTLRSLMALALIFWCAGAGCMVVSYARASMTESTASSGAAFQMMAGASSSMDAHACCKAKHRSANGIQTPRASTASSILFEQSLLAIPSVPSQSGVMNCCPLTSGSIVGASRSPSNDQASALHDASSSSLLLVNSDPRPLSIPLRLPNRARSYLLDCAFLI